MMKGTWDETHVIDLFFLFYRDKSVQYQLNGTRHIDGVDVLSRFFLFIPICLALQMFHIRVPKWGFYFVYTLVVRLVISPIIVGRMDSKSVEPEHVLKLFA